MIIYWLILLLIIQSILIIQSRSVVLLLIPNSITFFQKQKYLKFFFMNNYSLGRFKNKIDIRTVGICKLWILWIHKKNNKTVIELNRIWSETIEYIIKYTIWWRVCEAIIEKQQKIIKISWKFMKIIRIKISWQISYHDVLYISTWCNDDTN